MSCSWASGENYDSSKWYQLAHFLPMHDTAANSWYELQGVAGEKQGWLSCRYLLTQTFDVRKKPKGALMSALNILILHFLFLSQEIRNTEKFGFYVSSRDILRPIKCTSFQIHLNCSFAWNIPFMSSMMSLIYSINSIGPRHSFFYCRLQIGAFIVFSKLT